MIDYEMEHIFTMTADLESPMEVIGPCPEGIRVNAYVTGGEVTGPRLRGKVRPVGGDWLTLRTDGVGILDVRATLETEDGALIYVFYQGVSDLGQNGYQDFLEQKVPPTIKLHTSPRFQTAHPNYQWLNRVQCVGIGEGDMQRSTVRYDIYALR